jgi:uncharacterized protein with PIN domain
VRERHDAFRRCPSCRRVYWAGSHHRSMERLVQALSRGRGRSPRGGLPGAPST